MVRISTCEEMVLSTEWAQVEVIDLVNDGNGLGFNIVGGRSTGVVIKYVIPGSAADKDGRLQGGDHVLQVGAVNLRGFTSEQVASVLRQSGNQVRLLVARPIDPSSTDFRTITNQAPIVPTKTLIDPEQLDKHLIENGYSETYNAIPQCYEERISENQQPETTEDDIKKDTTPVVDKSPSIAPDLPETEVVSVELNKNVYGLGVTVAGYVCEKEELSGIFVKSIIEGSSVESSGQIKINDRIIEVDGQSLLEKTNHQAVEILRNTDISVTLVLHRYLRGPKFEHLQVALWNEHESPTHSSPSITTLSWFPYQSDATEIQAEPESQTTIDSGTLEPEYTAGIDVKEKWQSFVGANKDIIVCEIEKLSGLGISLEGTVDVEDGLELRPHHYIRSVLPDGPVGVQGILHAGDELLQVNNYPLQNFNHSEVVSILKKLPSSVRIVCARNSIDYGPRPVINIAPDREGFETRKIISGSIQNLSNLVKAQSDGSINTSSTATLTDHSKKSRSLECVSRLALWHSTEEIVDIVKGEQGLGFSILDYQDPQDPVGTVIVVRSLVPGGAAEVQGGITAGDRVVSVNGSTIKNATLDRAVHVLKGAPLGIVRIGMCKPLSSYESETKLNKTNSKESCHS